MAVWPEACAHSRMSLPLTQTGARNMAVEAGNGMVSVCSYGIVGTESWMCPRSE